MVPITQWGRLGNQMFQLAFLFAQAKRGAIPDMYVQYPSFFDEFREEIQAMFGQGIGPTRDVVAVHVRRTDYLTDKAFVSLSDTDYYERAMALFPESKFLVCSDDPAWCLQRWPRDSRVEVVHGTEIEDLNLMASCKSIIMANSSFSWWAAYLNPNPQKIVIYPKHWHSDGVSRVGFPEGWIRL